MGLGGWIINEGCVNVSAAFNTSFFRSPLIFSVLVFKCPSSSVLEEARKIGSCEKRIRGFKRSI